MSTILSRVSGLRIHAFAPEPGNISSSDLSGRSEMRTMGMSFLFDCDLRTSLRRLPLMLGRLTSRKMMSGVLLARTWLNSIQLDAVSTVHPSRSSNALPSFRTKGLSSRTRTVTLDSETAMRRMIHFGLGTNHARHGSSAAGAAIRTPPAPPVPPSGRLLRIAGRAAAGLPAPRAVRLRRRRDRLPRSSFRSGDDGRPLHAVAVRVHAERDRRPVHEGRSAGAASGVRQGVLDADRA